MLKYKEKVLIKLKLYKNYLIVFLNRVKGKLTTLFAPKFGLQM